jgi:hypothetical protein
MVGQTDKLFGSTMIGVDELAIELANRTEERFVDNKTINTPVQVLVCGMGVGKSTFLQNHRQQLLNHCKNTDLVGLLQNNAIEINITFNSDYCFNKVYEKNLLKALCKRVILSYFGLEWATTLELPEDYPSMFSHTLQLITKHYNSSKGNAEDRRVVFILNIDEVNYLATDTSHQLMISELLIQLRNEIHELSEKHYFFIPLVALTSIAELADGIVGSGVTTLQHSLKLFTFNESLELLVHCGLPESYAENYEFKRLISDAGGVPRLLRIIFQSLDVNYNANCIEAARRSAKDYLIQKRVPTDSSEVKSLVNCVMQGTRVLKLEYSSYQTKGIVWLTPCEANGLMSYVEIPILLLEMFCEAHSKNVNDVNRTFFLNARTVLSQLKVKTWEDFENFCATYHAFKRCHVSDSDACISLHDFYGNIDMPNALKGINLTTSARKEISVLALTRRVFDNPKANCDDEISKLESGSVLRSGCGAKTDIVMHDTDSYGNVVIRAVCCAHTLHSLPLNMSKIASDKGKTKTMKKFFSNPQVISIHISNRILREVSEIEGAIYIGLNEWIRFAGPTIQRNLQSPDIFILESPEYADNASAVAEASEAGDVNDDDGDRVNEVGDDDDDDGGIHNRTTK